ncbi:MAG: helix-turn-helix domain-containing protein [Anaerolineae bacterium]
MAKYGQFCPVARSLEILGDRWTLLIIRDMLGGVTHFNDLERGLPGISRALLAARLRQLQKAGILVKQANTPGRQSTEYRLTQAGQELAGVIGALTIWGEAWAFGEPAPDELDPVLLMWWMRGDARTETLPQDRIVVQYDLRHGKQAGYFWLVLTRADVTLCLTDPGYEVDVLVTADVAALYKLWWGQINYEQAIHDYGVRVEGLRRMVKAFPTWFAWEAAEGMRAVRNRREAGLPMMVAGG